MFYFAYGSNLNWHHMRMRCESRCEIVSKARLAGYELGFDERGYANIRPKVGETVYGLVYELDQPSLDSLDRFEGYPKVFGREMVTVKDEDNNRDYQAWVYLEPADRFGGIPRKEYLDRVLDAAKSCKLPAAWISRLESYLPLAKEDSYF